MYQKSYKWDHRYRDRQEDTGREVTDKKRRRDQLQKREKERKKKIIYLVFDGFFSCKSTCIIFKNSDFQKAAKVFITFVIRQSTVNITLCSYSALVKKAHL